MVDLHQWSAQNMPLAQFFVNGGVGRSGDVGIVYHSSKRK